MSNYYILTSDGTFVSDDELCHYGVKGQKWGVRRYQNADGTLTDAGKKRYDKEKTQSLERKRDAAYREYREFLTRKFKPVDDPIYEQYERYLDAHNRKDSIEFLDKWYKRNVPKNSPYWEIKRQEEELYNKWKEYTRKAEKSRTYSEQLENQTYNGKNAADRCLAKNNRRLDDVVYGWSEVGGSRFERLQREVERKLDEERRRREEQLRWENGAGKIKSDSGITGNEARNFLDDLFTF